MNTEADYDKLVQFWCENSGWDIVTRKEWEARFITIPNGPSVFALGIQPETDEIISQFLFIPISVALGSATVKGYRLFGAIIKESIRNQGTSALQELMGQMYFTAFNTFSNSGTDSLVYVVPDPRWMRALQKFTFIQHHAFPLYSLPLPQPGPAALPLPYALETIHATDPRIDGLWEKARLTYSSMVTRDSETLAWKMSLGRYTLTGVTHQSSLVGLFATVHKPQDHQLLICDLLVADQTESLAVTLQAAVTKAHDYYNSLPEGQTTLTKVAILATPRMQPVLEEIGFTAEKYAFNTIIHLFDPAIEPEQVAPQNWYFSAND
jgi:hypothetical protein